MKKFHAKDSYIIRFFTFLTNVVYAVLSVSGLGKIFTSYSNLEQRFRSSGIGRCLNTSERAGSRGRRAVRRGIALAMERSMQKIFHKIFALRFYKQSTPKDK